MQCIYSFRRNTAFGLVTVSCIFGTSTKQMKPKSTRKMSETELVFFLYSISTFVLFLSLSLQMFAFVLSADGVGGGVGVKGDSLGGVDLSSP